MSEIIASTYEIIERIGSGGGGVVLLANHLRLHKKVVLKADRRSLATRQDLLRREVDILKSLSYPHIPQVYDYFEENGNVYTVIEYIEGVSLDKPLKQGTTFSQAQVVQWAAQILDALRYLHSPTHGDPPQGFVHSDIKPANIMLTPGGEIYLIDFNIALALGEENAVGCSAGYASPEHYGLDFSSGEVTATQPQGGAREHTSSLNPPKGRPVRKTGPSEQTTETLSQEGSTVTLGQPLDAAPLEQGDSMSGSSSASYGSAQTSRRKRVVPDVRSDIYGLGATLYHLLSGRRPAKNATDVIPLSPEKFSPQIVAIISKAMNKNPDLRYQSAEEMLDALKQLRQNDARTRRLQQQRRCACTVCSILLVLGLAIALVGLKRIQITEGWLRLAEYSRNALAEGDAVTALDYALEAFPKKTGLLTPSYSAEAQAALTEALGIYDLSDGFRTYTTVELPFAPLYMTMAPGGETAACVYSGYVAVIDLDSAEILATLPADVSALSEVEYLDDSVILYAGEDGLTAYDIESGTELWRGGAATAISVSADDSTVAAVYKDAEYAVVYDAGSGTVLYTVDFGGRSQSVAENDIFANPNDNLFELNADGSWLVVSFDDGSLSLYHLLDTVEILPLLNDTSGFTYFEGGFYQNYLAFSATNNTDTMFAVFDVETETQTMGVTSEGYYNVQANETGIYISIDNLLVTIDPATGTQTPLADTAEEILHYAVGGDHTLVVTESGLLFFDSALNLIAQYESYSCDFCLLAPEVGLTGSLDTAMVSIFRYENHAESEVCAYDSDYEHDEARLSADGKTLMLFSYDQFRIYDMNGTLICQTDILDPDQVYDQQFVREGSESWLEVTYYDGTVAVYSARDGFLTETRQEAAPDTEADTEFIVDSLRIVAPLHGTAVAYAVPSGKVVKELEDDGYLIYVYQIGEYFITQYTNTSGELYGYLLDENCEVLACLPNLCDVVGDMLLFDYPTGDIRASQVYGLDALLTLAREVLGE